MADPTAGQVSWAELDVTHGHTGDVAWAELQVANIATAGLVSWTEVETSNVATRGLVSWTEVQTSNVGTRGQVSWTEIQTSNVATRGQVSWGELELRKLPTAGRLSFVEIATPLVVAPGAVSHAYLQLPKSYAASFALSNGTVDVFQTANLTAIQAAGQITHVDITSAGVYYTEADDIVITAEHSSNNGLSEDAVLTADLGAQSTKAGVYRDTKGFLSADKFLQDESYYNEHTYVVRVAESFDRWHQIYKKVIHPAGFQLVGEFVAVMVPNAFTLTVEDATVIDWWGGAGGFAVTGTATQVRARVIEGAGGVEVGGDADQVRARVIEGAGGVEISGEATVTTVP